MEIEELSPYERNAKKHGERQLQELTNELTACGESDEEYTKFVEKFKPKLTTDDCMTPPAVYECVKDWAVSEYGWQGRPIVRPFYPGGDYQSFDYPENCVVIDNPPFSFESDIVRWYEERRISYFLFAPELTLFSTARGSAHYVVASCAVAYENGARVNTDFVCSEGPKIRIAGSLGRLVAEAQETEAKSREKYDYPVSVVTAARLEKWAKCGLDCEFEDCEFVRALDSQKAAGKGVYGTGFFVSEKAAEKAAVKWELSARERAVVERLNAQYEARQVNRDGAGRAKACR